LNFNRVFKENLEPRVKKEYLVKLEMLEIKVKMVTEENKETKVKRE
jgi:hypothetical protein